MMIRETILKFIERKASLQEQKEVLEWIESSDENRKEFARLKNLSVAVDILGLEQTKQKTKIRKIAKRTMKVAAVLVAAISAFMLGQVVQEYKWKNEASCQFTEITAPQGEVLNFTLPCGSKVILNSGSTLKFSQLYNKTQRDVYLSGEGYFEVKKDSKKFNVVYPIESPLLKLGVLGTSFNVSSYPNKNKIITTLYNGSIEIEDLNTTEVFHLDPDSRLIYEKESGRSSVETISDSYRWTDKYLIAKDEDISTFTKRLEDIFNVNIIIDAKLIGNCRYTGALPNGSLQQILDNMTYVSPIQYSIEDNGKTVVIKRK